MTRIDRYLLVLYVRVLLICFLSVCGLLIVVDIFSNLDEFVRSAEQSQVSLASILVNYYGPYTLSMFERLSGLLALLALLFAIAWLNRTNEFTALLAAGVTKWRVVRPLLIASVVVVLGASAMRELAVPQFQDRLDRNPQDLTGDLPRPLRPTYDFRAAVLIQGKHLLPIKSEIVAPNLKIQGGPLAKTCGSKIVAAKAQFQPSNGNRPAGYLLTDVHYPKAIDTIASTMDALTGLPILLTSFDTDWVAPGTCFLASEIEFEMLRGGSAWKQFASTGELIEHIQGTTGRGGNDLRVQIHQRIMRPFVDWTVLLLGIPVLLTRPDRHMFWIAGACLGIVAGFTIVVMGLAALGSSGALPPGVAVWLPLLIFLPWAWAKTTRAMET
ncbi:MAG: LptF/LptG family permease [Pirellulaceae bacterium]